MFSPIVQRELLVASRRSGLFALRIGAAAAVMGTAMLALFRNDFGLAPAALGQSVFQGIATLAFAFALFSGIFLTADAISEERREGTFGLLFLTDLTPFDVVFGKLAARSISAVYCLLAVLPVMAIPLLLGGTGAREYVRATLAIVDALVFSLTAGMLVSSYCRQLDRAIIGTLMLIMSVAGLVPGLLVVFARLSGLGGSEPAWWLLCSSPAYAFFSAFETNYRFGAQSFWVPLVLVALFSAGMLWMLLRRVACIRYEQRQESEGDALLKLSHWLASRTTQHRTEWLEENPVAYLGVRTRWLQPLLWALVGLVAINIGWLATGNSLGSNDSTYRAYFGNTVYFINRVWITMIGCRVMLEARRTGLLELLLVSPLEEGRIVGGLCAALRRAYFAPVIAIGLLHVWYVMETARQYSQQGIIWNASLMSTYVVVTIGSFTGFVCDLVALTLFGMWRSLVARKGSVAVLQTFGLVIAIPWIISYYLPLTLISLPGGSWGYYLFRPVVTVLKDFGFAAYALWHLKHHFGAAASGELSAGASQHAGRVEAPEAV